MEEAKMIGVLVRHDENDYELWFRRTCPTLNLTITGFLSAAR